MYRNIKRRRFRRFIKATPKLFWKDNRAVVKDPSGIIVVFTMIKKMGQYQVTVDIKDGFRDRFILGRFGSLMKAKYAAKKWTKNFFN